MKGRLFVKRQTGDEREAATTEGKKNRRRATVLKEDARSERTLRESRT